MFEVKKMNDCKEGDLIDWGTKLQVGCLYTFGAAYSVEIDSLPMPSKR